MGPGGQVCKMVYFQSKTPNLGKIGKENVVIFCDQLEYFTAIWYNFWHFAIVFGHLVHFPVLICLDQEESGNPVFNPPFHSHSYFS
jgi:hypothetical protein